MQRFPEKIPTLETKRLILRELKEKDLPLMAELANDYEVSKNLSTMPYPYSLDNAKEWIVKCKEKFSKKDFIPLAICDKERDEFMGFIDIDISVLHNHATLGYWLGRKHWGKGYMSEALRKVLEYGFKELDLYRMTAYHFHINPASGKVMQKCGMEFEGNRRGHFKRGEEYLDILGYGILKFEYNKFYSL